MFGRDGDIDLVAGNIGLNTKSKAAEKSPSCFTTWILTEPVNLASSNRNLNAASAFLIVATVALVMPCLD